MTWLKSPRISAAGPRIRGGGRYKVLGSDSDLCRHSTLIPCTHECYDFILHIGRRRAHSSIFAATALLATATPSRLRHSPGPIVLHTQQPSFEPCRSASVVARTARCPTASKPAQQPVRGVSRILPLGSAKVTNDGARDHSMDHTDSTHHASALEPQPRAAIHLHPS